MAEIGGQGEGLERQVEIAHNRVVDSFEACRVDPNVVGGPKASEFITAGGQFPDEVSKPPIVGAAAGLRAQQCDCVNGDLVPVPEELGRERVEEDEPGLLGGLVGSA